MMKRLLAALALIAVCAAPAFGQLGSVPYPIPTGSTSNSSHMNTMLSQIYANSLNRTGGTMTGTLTTLSVLPTADNASDLGSALLSYRNAWVDGTLTVGTLSATSISGGLGALTSIIQTTLTTQQALFRYDASNHFGITVASNGATTFDATGSGAAFTIADALNVTGKLTVTLTSAQIRAAYDGSNHMEVSVASNGATTFNATGAGQAFAFSDPLSVTGTVSASGVFISNSVSGIDRVCDMTAGDATITGGLTTDCVAADPSAPSVREEIAALKAEIAQLRALLGARQ